MTSCHSRVKASSAKLCLQERDKTLLADLFLQRLMSRDQIIELGYFGSVPRCNNRLKKLVDHGFIRRHEFSSWGSGSQSLYGPGQAATQIIASKLGLDISDVIGQTRRDVPPMLLAHTLGLVDLRIRFDRDAMRYRLDEFEWLPEARCRHEYSVKQASSAWQRHIVKPDAFTRWMIGGKVTCFFVELDLGHVSQGAFTKKVEAYQRYLGLGAFGQVYESSQFDVLVVTTGERRLAHLKSVTGRCQQPRFLFTTGQRLLAAGPLGAIWEHAEGFITLPGVPS